MTTGRINQVTILTLEPEGSNVNSRRSRAVTERRKDVNLEPQWDAPWSKATQGYLTIHLPPLSSSQGGPLHKSQSQKAVSQCNIHLARGGYHSRVTSKDGYPIRFAPECLRNRFDHRSLIHRLQQSLPAS
jgi:hypothetical protein